MRKLTPMQRLFVKLYRGNGALAAIGVGVPEEQARPSASRWLSLPHVAAAIRAREEKESLGAIATRQELMARWTKIVRDPTTDPELAAKYDLMLGKATGCFLEAAPPAKDQLKLPDGLQVEELRALAQGPTLTATVEPDEPQH
jgi:hypothetical protein